MSAQSEPGPGVRVLGERPSIDAPELPSRRRETRLNQNAPLLLLPYHQHTTIFPHLAPHPALVT
jgi:hypothetical protein